jgi:hypothetical protein
MKVLKRSQFRWRARHIPFFPLIPLVPLALFAGSLATSIGALARVRRLERRLAPPAPTAA